VLLQDIATLTGGVFHAIHSSADIGDLHEIYVHLQALTGGEEVIASGSDSVDGLSIAGAGAAATGADIAGGALGRELSRLAPLHVDPADAPLLARFTPHREHAVWIDDSLSSVVMMVSWHDPSVPVSLILKSPSGVIRPGSRFHYNQRGSSYLFFRIENPKPGQWILYVHAARTKDRTDRLFSAPYTWGVYGTSPLGIRYKVPMKLVGAQNLKVAAKLMAPRDLVRSARYNAHALIPVSSVKDLLEQYSQELRSIDRFPKPDNPKLDPNLYRLAILDQLMRRKGRESIFSRKKIRLMLSEKTGYADTIKTSVPGLYAMSLAATGKTLAGHRFQRQVRFDVRI
jgi:hypothetical protein